MEVSYNVSTWLVDGVGKILQVAGIIGKAVGWICDIVGQAILDHLSISEKVWDTHNPEYILSDNALTIGHEAIAKLEQQIKENAAVAAASEFAPEYMQAKIQYVFNSVKLFVAVYNQYIKETFKVMLAADASEFLTLKIAFLAGVWNGLVDFIGGLLKFIGLIASAVYEIGENIDDIIEMFDSLCVYLGSGTITADIGKAMSDAWDYALNKLKDPNGSINEDKVAYAIGFGAAFILSFFIPFTQLTKIANFSKVGKLFLPARYIEEISTAASNAGRIISEKTATAYKEAVEIFQKILTLLRQGQAALTTFFKNIADDIIKWFLKQKQAVRDMLKAIDKRLILEELFDEWGVFVTKYAAVEKFVADLAPFLIKSFEERIMSETLEHVGIFTRNGKFFEETSGLAHQVEISRKYVGKLLGAIVSHNHPLGGSLSPGDIMMFMENGLKELRVKCANPDHPFFGHVFPQQF